MTRFRAGLALAAALALVTPVSAAETGALDTARLKAALTKVARESGAKLGACVRAAPATVCVGEGRAYPMQSVMKLLVALAALDAVDQGRLAFDTPVTVHKADLGPYPQGLAERVTDAGFPTDVRDLIHRAVAESDSDAVNVLIERLGGIAVVQSFLAKVNATGIRIDRDERDLQADNLGLHWRPDYADPAVFERAKAALSDRQRSDAYDAYRRDPRDTATPEAMVALLEKLAAGTLLSPASTAHIRQVMGDTVTGVARLKAGLPPGWTLQHKTGTSSTWQGLTAATNDVGIVTAPDGRQIELAVFVADSRKPSKETEAGIAAVARALAEAYRPAGARSP